MRFRQASSFWLFIKAQSALPTAAWRLTRWTRMSRSQHNGQIAMIAWELPRIFLIWFGGLPRSPAWMPRHLAQGVAQPERCRRELVIHGMVTERILGPFS